MDNLKSKLIYIQQAVARATWKKVWNLSKIQIQKHFFKSDKSWGYPIILVFDPSSICNLHCPLCPTGQGRKERSKGIASFENFKRIMVEVEDYLFFVQFTNWGEPIVNKELTKMIKYSHQKNIETVLRTNLTLANKNICESLINAGLDEIIISLDGASEKTYLKYRRGGNFPKVIENIKHLVAVERKCRSNIRIIWQFIVSSQNEYEIPKARQMSKKLGAELRVVPLRVDMGNEVTADRTKQIKKDFSWLPRNEKLSRYNYSKKQNRYFEKTCRWLWTKLVVNWNGSVSPCCAIWEEKFDFGNAFDEGLMAIWNGYMYQAARKLVREKKPVKNIICSKCLKNGFVN